MFKFLLLQWKVGKVTEAHLNQAVVKGWITEAGKDEILATPLD